MQFNALSLYSIILAIVLAIVATVRAAPDENLGSSNVTNDAPSSVPFSAANLYDYNDKKSGQASRFPTNDAIPTQQAGLPCWDAYISNRQISITCSGSRWCEWTDCKDRYRYQAGPLSGTYRGAIACLLGSTAIRGGAFGF
ncbi:MAG: hypothetical protein J3R72DRAFT_511126 [Linnemannia gamsii]|nr:MAG: hypothetical protein J3R72DRAFT_511126 [Linnemannia gamsii]